MDTTMVYFSAHRCCFIPAQWRDDGTYSETTWPEDAVLLTDEEVSIFWKISAPIGKMLSTEQGRPKWEDLPPPSYADLVLSASKMLNSLVEKANAKIMPLERAVRLQVATEEEKSQLTEWELYSVLLNRIDINTAPDITWPEAPQ